MSEAAARSVTTDEEGWRAAVIAREELKNAGSGENRAAGGGDDPPFDVADRLEEMRKSVAARRKR
jgi:hypothetical protein